MLISWVVLLIAVVGLVLWLATDGKLSSVGQWMFICGLLVTCLLLGGRPVRLL